MKKMTFKKVTSVLLVCAMLIGVLPVSVFAADTTATSEIPETLTTGLNFAGTGKGSYARTETGLSEKPKTIEAWVKFGTAPAEGSEYSKQAVVANSTGDNTAGRWGLYTTENGELCWTETTGAGVAIDKALGQNVWTGEWMHVAIVRSSSVMYTYINGTLVNTYEDTNMGETYCDSTSPLTIGFCGVAGSLNGAIGDIRLWNVERSQAEIQNTMYSELSGRETGLMNYWSFDEQEGGIAKDSTAASNDAILLGATWTDDATKTWNFNDASQMNDFIVQSHYNVSPMNISNGILTRDSQSGYSRIVSKEGYKNIKSMSVDVILGASPNGKCHGGFILGVPNPPTAGSFIWAGRGNAEGIDGVFVCFGGRNDNDKNFSLYVAKQYNGSYSWTLDPAVGNNIYNPTFLSASPTQLKGQVVHVRADFGDNEVTITARMKENPTQVITTTVPVDSTKLDGLIGLRAEQTLMQYDNWTVSYENETLTEGLNFAGSGKGSYVRTEAGLSEKPKTIETWVKFGTAPAEGSEYSKQAVVANYAGDNTAGRWGLYTTENGELCWTETTEAGVTIDRALGQNVWTGEWMHVAIVRSSGVMYTYINGTLVDTYEDANMGETYCDSTSPLTIGFCDLGGSLNGAIGDIRLWNVERSQAEIQSTMSREVVSSETGLMNHWSFDEQEGGIAKDSTAASNDAILLGATWTDDATKTWNFNDASQINDFDVQSHYGVSPMNISNSILTRGSSSGYSRIVSKEGYKNIKSMSVDMILGGATRCHGGFILGASNASTSSGFWGGRGGKEGIDGVFVCFGARYENDKRFSLYVAKQYNGSYSWTLDPAVGTNIYEPTFLSASPANLSGQVVHVRADFGDNEVTITARMKDNPTQVVTTTVPVDSAKLDGPIGLRTEQSVVNYDNWTVSYTEVSEFSGMSLDLEGQIGVNCYVPSNHTLSDNAEVKFTLPNGEPQTVTIQDAENNATEHGAKFTCYVPAKEMTDTIVATLYDNGEVKDTKNVSVRDYAATLIDIEKDITDAEYKKATDLAISLLDYGAYAQTYFKYKTNDLANNIYSAGAEAIQNVTADTIKTAFEGTDSALVTEKQWLEGVGTLARASLILESETTLKMYFDLEGEPANVQFSIGENTVEHDVRNGYYVVEITNITAKDLDTNYTVTVNVDGQEFAVAGSAMAFCYKALSLTDEKYSALQDLTRTLYLYNVQANAYFN